MVVGVRGLWGSGGWVLGVRVGGWVWWGSGVMGDRGWGWGW